MNGPEHISEALKRSAEKMISNWVIIAQGHRKRGDHARAALVESNIKALCEQYGLQIHRERVSA